jgi:hypothetical protein
MESRHLCLVSQSGPSDTFGTNEHKPLGPTGTVKILARIFRLKKLLCRRFNKILLVCRVVSDRIEATSRLKYNHGQAGFTELLCDHSTTGAAPHDDDIDRRFIWLKISHDNYFLGNQGTMRFSSRVPEGKWRA